MKTGNLITGLVAVAAVTAVFVAFMNNSSPYMTMSQARKTSEEHVHLAGDMIKDSLKTDIGSHTVQFSIRDTEGTVVHVVYKGDAPANLSEATKVVAIGHVQGQDFTSDKLLVKCPSKYEADPNKKSDSASAT